MIRKIFLGPVLLGLLPAVVSAADGAYVDHSGIYIGPVVDVGFDFGGDKLGTIEYTDGSSQDINTGQGGLIARRCASAAVQGFAFRYQGDLWLQVHRVRGDQRGYSHVSPDL